ncbi:MAG: hydroxymyristoyl-ACP dehydratase [Paludibacteraceae bacterium]|nr:hydroxymyristoyl-ACP dehydratase [Paludibacteraceae bacterium]MBR3871172.1 hydroxymyristoyl-ACP dehydratase [Paludibacteraceae bacterium]
MEKQPLFKGEEIFELIPQRAPIVMVDTLYEADDVSGKTGLTISEDNIFCRDNHMQEPGLIEHIAQSAAAFAGYKTFKDGLPPKLGFIGEIKKCKINTLPKAGERLTTNLKVLGEAAGITLVSAETFVSDTLIVSCQMKIFIQE